MRKEHNWHAHSAKEVLNFLKTRQCGLSVQEARKRLKLYGKNVIHQKSRFSKLQILLSQFQSPLIYILLIATVISFALSEIMDALIILAAVILNTVLGYIQESKANDSIRRLRLLIQHKAKVIRDGKLHEIDAALVVPGDIVSISAGDRIPADGRILKAHSALVVEAPLTGESVPASKSEKIIDKGTVLAERENMVFMGTSLEAGKCLFVVTQTGKNTQLGRISELLINIEEEKTPLQIQLSRLAKILGSIITFIALVLFLGGIFTGRDIFEIFLISVAVAVSAIPEGLVISITIILAIGMQKILQAKALTRRLVAAETLGSVSVICSDKTGTMTLGEMRLSFIVDSLGQDMSENKHEEYFQALEIGALCNGAQIEDPPKKLEQTKILGNFTDKAFIQAAMVAGIDVVRLQRKNPVLDEIPFNHEDKFMATLHRLQNGENIIYVKGAPEVIIEASTNYRDGLKDKKINTKLKQAIHAQYRHLTEKGFRVLALAYKKVTKSYTAFEKDFLMQDLVLVGFAALKDPLRDDIANTLRQTDSAGIRSVIITGDHKMTAKVIASEAGLNIESTSILEGRELDKMSDKELIKKVRGIQLYARVSPRHKLRIINAWQRQNAVVAMTGDGVNDAPALKKADVGIALGSGTDVAKETADIVLLDDSFKTIVMVIRQGRIIFDNMRKVIVYLLADSFSEVILVVGSLLFGLPLPILATQILWVNLINDGLPSIALSFEDGEEDIMKRKPRSRGEPILNRPMKILIFGIGFISDFLIFIVFLVFLKNVGIDQINYIRTIIFTSVAVDSLIYIFSIRSFSKSLFFSNPLANRYLVAAVLISFGMQSLAIYVPLLQNVFHTVRLGIFEWTLILALAFIKVIGIEAVKYFFIKRNLLHEYQHGIS